VEALKALAALPAERLPRAAPPADGGPVTAVTPMLQAASVKPIPGGIAGGRPDDPIDAGLIRQLAGIEQLAGASPAVARTTALRILAERDEGLARAQRLDPPPMSEAAFLEGVRTLLNQLAAPTSDVVREAAA
jgi:hypothetical protein